MDSCLVRSGTDYLRGKEKRMSIKVIKNRCPQNHVCPAVKACPFGALKQEGFSAPVVDGTICVDCGACVRICPMQALTKGE